MKFGPVAFAEAAGGILAHSLRHAGGILKKGTVLSAEDVAALRGAGVETVVVARLEPGDIHEGRAAQAIEAGPRHMLFISFQRPKVKQTERLTGGVGSGC